MSDRVMFIVVGIALAAYALVLLVQLGLKIRDWWRHHSAVNAMIDTGRVPADYGVVRREQERLNKIDIDGSLMDRTLPDVELTRTVVASVRETASHIRFSGYRIGEQDQDTGLNFELGVQSNPFPTGSGEAKQWVRGYCMARNVLDIKQYYNAA